MKETQHSRQTMLEFLALDGVFARMRGLEAPGDALTWTRFCGSLALVLVVLLFLSGSCMLFYYSPYPGAAYDSVQYAQYEVPFGDVIRGVHHWSWNLLLVVMGIHMMRAFFVAAYKTPRQMVWISGLLTFPLVPVCIITGDLLPWTQPGYWTTQVRGGIITSIPGVGELLLSLLQGGPRIGVVALTRFFVLHAVFLPLLLSVLLAVHFHFLAWRGLAEPLSASVQERRRVKIFPVILNRWLLLFILTAAVMGTVAHFWLPVPYADPADPTDSSFVPHPEWWVLFLNKLVSIFTGPWTVVATVILPGALFGLLMLLPFLDRSPERRPLKRWKSLLVATLLVASILALSCLSYLEHYGAP
ncbi:MAG: cytochrome bc complex cytochrome b subunit [Syntrophobacteraceae bacterium]